MKLLLFHLSLCGKYENVEDIYAGADVYPGQSFLSSWVKFKLKHFAHLTSPAYVFIKTGVCPQAG